MQKLMILVLTVVMLSAACVGMASAQQYNPNIYSFTRSANFMSLIGYDRWQTHVETGKWLLR